jgi:hypothetical protein
MNAESSRGDQNTANQSGEMVRLSPRAEREMMRLMEAVDRANQRQGFFYGVAAFGFVCALISGIAIVQWTQALGDRVSAISDMQKHTERSFELVKAQGAFIEALSKGTLNTERTVQSAREEVHRTVAEIRALDAKISRVAPKAWCYVDRNLKLVGQLNVERVEQRLDGSTVTVHFEKDLPAEYVVIVQAQATENRASVVNRSAGKFEVKGISGIDRGFCAVVYGGSP